MVVDAMAKNGQSRANYTSPFVIPLYRDSLELPFHRLSFMYFFLYVVQTLYCF